MANVKISGLPAATSVTAGTDVAPLVSGGITTKATPQQIVNAGLLAPGAIGSGTASTGAFTTLSASSTVSGTGFSTYLASPPAIGGTAPSTGKFTTVESTIATGTAPFTVASTTNVANLNASSLGGATFAAPGAIGSGTASTGAFTTLSASSTVSGTGFSTYLLSPPAIGTTAPAAGKFTDLTSTGNTTIGDASTDTFTVYPQTISLINSTAITAASTKTLTLNANAGSNGIVLDASNNTNIGTSSQILTGSKVSISGSGSAGQGPISLVNTSSSTKKWYCGPDSGGAFCVFNDALTGAYLAYGGTTWLANVSDSRLKNKIDDIKDAVSAISKLNPLTFYLKNEPNEGTPRYGFFAQNVGEAIPDAMIVSSIQDENIGELYTYDPSIINVYLVKAIQEIVARLEVLESNIK